MQDSDTAQDVAVLLDSEAEVSQKELSDELEKIRQEISDHGKAD